MPCPVVWRAPVALTYTPLVMRITVVVDQTTTCEGQGLTLVHFSAQLEPCLSQENTQKNP